MERFEDHEVAAPVVGPASIPLGDLAGLPALGSTVAAGGLASLTSGADAEAELVKGVLNHQLVLSKRSMAAATFLYSHGLGDVAAYALELKKYQQRPSGLVKALDAVSLKQFMQGVQVSLNNGK